MTRVFFESSFNELMEETRLSGSGTSDDQELEQVVVGIVQVWRRWIIHYWLKTDHWQKVILLRKTSFFWAVL